jgi:hypothetical protein
MPPTGSEPAIPDQILDRTATGIGKCVLYTQDQVLLSHYNIIKMH